MSDVMHAISHSSISVKKENVMLLKRDHTIGTGDFSHMCKVARVESSNFPFRIM